MILVRSQVLRRLAVLLTIMVLILFGFPPLPKTIAVRGGRHRPFAHAGSVWAQEPKKEPARSPTQEIIPSTLSTSVANLVRQIPDELVPTLPVSFSMSKFSIQGYVKGGWPFVIDYELEPDSTVTVSFEPDVGRTFTIVLPSTDGHRDEIVHNLPEEVCGTTVVGRVSFEALKIGVPSKQPAHFFLYGLGMGPNAVGSMVIDQLRFQPGEINLKLKQEASYSFHSRSDFGTVSAEFRQPVSPGKGVDVDMILVAQKTFENGVRRGDVVTEHWNGRTYKGRPSLGLHQFFVRAWRSLRSGGDWLFAAEQDQVVTVVNSAPN